MEKVLILLEKSHFLWYNKYIKKVYSRGDFRVKTIEELIAEVEALKSKIEEQDKELKEKDEKIQSLEKVNNWYIEQLKLKAKEKFGASSEKVNSDQLSLFDLFNEAETLQEPITVEPELETVVKAHSRKKSKRGSKFDNLPVEVIEHKLDESEMICDVCGEPLTVMKEETRRELVIIPAQAKIIEHVTYTYSCRNCDKNGDSGFIKQAEHPKALIPKSIVSLESLAYIMNQKYTLAVPLYRQEQEFKRLGFELSRQNLSNWILKGAALLNPLYNELKCSLLNETLLHADETVLEVLNEPDKPATSKSYVWVYRTSTYNTHPVVLYEYTKGRGSVYPEKFLSNWSGTYLHCDGYAGYKKLENITLCGCLVHAKRKFHEALIVNPNNETAKTGEKYLCKLFALEHDADKQGMSLEERYLLRQTEFKTVIDEFYTWINSVKDKILPQSYVGKAIIYAINQKETLCSFLLDARIQLSNNLAEQSVKPFLIGRKNWLFSNTVNGATSSTIIYSIIQTAIAHDLIPEKYLTYVFTQIQYDKDVSTYLPWSEQIPEYCKSRTPQQK